MKADEFWAQLSKPNGESGCWEWSGYRTRAMGYGRMRFNGKGAYTHRVAYELANGPIPGGFCVCHSCDNPMCCNPAHLWLGTRSENIADRDAKGRNGKIKLTISQVNQIRVLYATGEHSQIALGRAFCVDGSTVSRIVRNKER